MLTLWPWPLTFHNVPSQFVVLNFCTCSRQHCLLDCTQIRPRVMAHFVSELCATSRPWPWPWPLTPRSHNAMENPSTEFKLSATFLFRGRGTTQAQDKQTGKQIGNNYGNYLPITGRDHKNTYMISRRSCGRLLLLLADNSHNRDMCGCSATAGIICINSTHAILQRIVFTCLITFLPALMRTFKAPVWHPLNSAQTFLFDLAFSY